MYHHPRPWFPAQYIAMLCQHPLLSTVKQMRAICINGSCADQPDKACSDHCHSPEPVWLWSSKVWWSQQHVPEKASCTLISRIYCSNGSWGWVSHCTYQKRDPGTRVQPTGFESETNSTLERGVGVSFPFKPYIVSFEMIIRTEVWRCTAALMMLGPPAQVLVWHCLNLALSVMPSQAWMLGTQWMDVQTDGWELLDNVNNPAYSVDLALCQTHACDLQIQARVHGVVLELQVLQG